MISLSLMPTLNAFLNSVCAILLLIGYALIRRKQKTQHKWCMIGAFAASVLFFVSYLTYHAIVGTIPFQGHGTIRLVYFTVLVSHTLLAALTLPLVLTTLARALKSDFDRHRRIARWTFPIWLYVSITGVVVYLMLYDL